jgi:3-hydroxyacyl-[acyl-carrier-protein] dehydratase
MEKLPLGIEQIRKLLPHRYPMLLVDRVLEISEGDNLVVVAEKLVSANEPFFQGHFPDSPVMPGVLIVEAMAQTSGLGMRYREPESLGRGMALVGIDRARFRRPVVPGDLLTLRSRLTRRRGDLFIFEAVAQVLGDTVAEARIMARLMDWEAPA